MKPEVKRSAGCLGRRTGTQRRALKKVDIGTPHIAGYTLEGKDAVLRKCLKLIASLLGMNSTCAGYITACARVWSHYAAWPADQPTLKRLVHLVYDVRRDDDRCVKSPGYRVSSINCAKTI